MPKNQDKKQNKKQDKKQLKRAALFYWSHSIYIAAEKACTAVGGFEQSGKAGGQYYCVVKKMQAFIRELEAITAAKKCTDVQAKLSGGRASLRAGYDCDMSDDCPDGQICIDGDCESPFS